MLQLILMGLLAAGLAFGAAKIWSGFTGQYIAEGAATQLAADKPLVEAAELRAKQADARAAQAESDAAAAVASVQSQNAAIEAAQVTAASAVKAAREQALKYANELAKNESRLSRLRAAATATPDRTRTCEAVLSATDQILTESLTARRQP